jgi:hypothetical protein
MMNLGMVFGTVHDVLCVIYSLENVELAGFGVLRPPLSLFLWFVLCH